MGLVISGYKASVKSTNDNSSRYPVFFNFEEEDQAQKIF